MKRSSSDAFSPKRLLVTGGAGFIGSHFIRHELETYPDVEVVNLDVLTYAGVTDTERRPLNLRDLEGHPRYTFIRGSVLDTDVVMRAIADVDAVVHFAAESHVDRSIISAQPFLTTNVLGTGVLLDATRASRQERGRAGVERFLVVGTDEVYGDFAGTTHKATEASSLLPSSPYAASKAAADLLALANVRTHNLPVLVTRSSNNYGPNQYPEKFLPLALTNLVEGGKVPLYGDGRQIRDWLYVTDNCTGIDTVLRRGRVGDIYNIGAEQDPELTNRDVIEHLLRALKLGDDRVERVADRPGHDRRYAIDASHIRALGWKPMVSFAEGIEKTIDWYRENEDWWRWIKSGDFQAWYEKNYSQRAQATSPIDNNRVLR